MLDVATAMVGDTGLTVSLDHISFEDVIREARVARSAVYRRWPYKDLFFSDLLKELARASTPAIRDDRGGLELIRRIALDRLDWLHTPQGRQDLCFEFLRQGSLHDFELIHGSTEWRTYLALHATFLSLADGELRSEVGAALAESEHGFIQEIAGTYSHLTGLLGYRLRPESNATYETLATLASATMRGLVVTALSTPAVVDLRVVSKPFGTSRIVDWSLPALGIAGLASSFLEPDPEIDWTDDRIASVRHQLAGR